MKKILFFILIIPILFTYFSPPLQEVLGHNSNLSSTLFGTDQMGFSGTEGLIAYNYEVKLLSLSPSVEDRISSEEDTSLFWTAYFYFYDADGNCGGKQFYNQSEYILTKKLADYQLWDKDSISKRQIELANLAVKSWPLK